MNSEITKAMNRKNSVSKIGAWWHKNHHKVFRVVLFPVWFAYLAKEKINGALNSKETWSEERATEIFNYYIPRVSDWEEEDKYFYFFDNGCGWGIQLAKRYLKRKDRRFWKVNCGWFGGRMRDFLINKFELDGFTKELYDCADGRTEIAFCLNSDK